MPPSIVKRKRTEGPLRSVKKPKRFTKQRNYHSSSESEDEDGNDDAPDFQPVAMDDSDDDAPMVAGKQSPPLSATESLLKAKDPKITDLSNSEDDDNMEDMAEGSVPSDDEQDDEFAGDVTDATSNASSDLDSDADSQVVGKKRKRNDPTAFATSMSKILSSKLSTSKRSDPVLSRSVAASTANKEMADSRLEAKAKQKLRAEKRAAMERGRVKDVLGFETEGVSAAEVQEREKRLKKTAQRGVVKLFNAVRAAQVQGERARERAREEGLVGVGQREERVNEMSKQGFLDLIAKGGKKGATIEEG